MFGLGYGNDTIIEHGGTDTVRPVGLSADDVTLARLGKGLVVTINGTGEQLFLSNFTASHIESFVFDDGTTISDGDLSGILSNTPPTAVDDFASVLEDATAPVTGNVLQNDLDESGTGLTVKNAGDYHGSYGTLVLVPTGPTPTRSTRACRRYRRSRRARRSPSRSPTRRPTAWR